MDYIDYWNRQQREALTTKAVCYVDITYQFAVFVICWSNIASNAH